MLHEFCVHRGVDGEDDHANRRLHSTAGSMSAAVSSVIGATEGAVSGAGNRGETGHRSGHQPRESGMSRFIASPSLQVQHAAASSSPLVKWSWVIEEEEFGFPPSATRTLAHRPSPTLMCTICTSLEQLSLPV